MSKTKINRQLSLYFTLFAALLIAAGLASAQWETPNSPAAESHNLVRSDHGSTRETGKLQISFSATSTETVYLPVISNIPSGKRIEVWADEQCAPILRSLADPFKQAQGVNLVVRQVPNINAEIMDAIPLGQGPDIFVGPHDRLGSWLEVGLVAPIYLGPKQADFAQVALDGFTSGGQLYGLPYAFENMGLFRNVDLVPYAPQTWGELLAAGQDLQASGKVSYTLALEDNGYKVYPILTSFGGYAFGREADGTWMVDDLGIDSPGMIAAGTWISDSIGAGLISPIAYDNNGAETLFETERIPFIMTGPWTLERFRKAGINYAISNFPDEGLPLAGVKGFLISAHSTEQRLAQTFLTDFVATAEIMELLYQSADRQPAYLPLVGSINDPDLVSFFEVGEGAELMPAIPEMGAVWGPWNNAVIQIITGAVTPEIAFTNAADYIREIIAGGPYLSMVNVPGSYQTLVGCAFEWDPACLTTAMTMTGGAGGVYTSSHNLPAGNYECKVALNGSWWVNYGQGGVQDGLNIPFSLASAGTVNFTYDPTTHFLTITTET